MKSILLAAMAFGSFIALTAPARAADFSISFNWDGLKLCTSGRPNTVNNPAVKVTGVPQGTTAIQFSMTDRDVPSYNHGGGWVEMSSDGIVPVGAFKYKSPCPPNGQHVYEWTATAKTKKGFGGKKLGTAKASRKYPG